MLAVFQKIFAFILSVLAFFGLVPKPAAPVSPVAPEAAYTAEAGKVEFALRGNITTGYEWTVAIDGDAVALTRDEYVSDPADPGVAGVGGTHYFAFAAAKPGTATLTFTYARPWETNGPIETRVAVVEVAQDLSVTVRSFTEA